MCNLYLEIHLSVILFKFKTAIGAINSDLLYVIAPGLILTFIPHLLNRNFKIDFLAFRSVKQGLSERHE